MDKLSSVEVGDRWYVYLETLTSLHAEDMPHCWCPEAVPEPSLITHPLTYTS